MKKTALALLGLALMGAPALADDLTLTIELEGTDYYSQESKKLLVGSHSVIQGNFSLVGVLMDNQINFSQGIAARQIKNQTSLEIVNNSTINIDDKENQIKGNVHANVVKSLFGSLKSISIKSQDYLALMQPVLERTGYNQLSALDISTEEMSVATSITSSDYECVAVNKQSTKCDSSVIMEIRISDQPRLDFTQCSFSSKSAGQMFIRAMNGNTNAVNYISEADLRQDPSCSSAISQALEQGMGVNDIAAQL